MYRDTFCKKKKKQTKAKCYVVLVKLNVKKLTSIVSLHTFYLKTFTTVTETYTFDIHTSFMTTLNGSVLGIYMNENG